MFQNVADDLKMAIRMTGRTTKAKCDRVTSESATQMLPVVTPVKHRCLLNYPCTTLEDQGYPLRLISQDLDPSV